VAEAERLFATEYWYYEHADGGYRLACDDYSLPEHVQKHVDFAMPTIQLDGLKPVAHLGGAVVSKSFTSAKIGAQPCGTLITVACLRELYNFPAGNSSAAGNEMGIGEWADYLNEADLPTFFKNFTSPPIPANTRPDFISIDGGLHANKTTVSQFSGVESALDFQSAYSIIYPQKLRLYQVGDGINMDSVGTFNIFLDALDASYCTYEGGDQPYVGAYRPRFVDRADR
jgi:tripeptidyl-peptidase I